MSGALARALSPDYFRSAVDGPGAEALPTEIDPLVSGACIPRSTRISAAISASDAPARAGLTIDGKYAGDEVREAGDYEFACGPLRPGNHVIAFNFTVRRAKYQRAVKVIVR